MQWLHDLIEDAWSQMVLKKDWSRLLLKLIIFNAYAVQGASSPGVGDIQKARQHNLEMHLPPLCFIDSQWWRSKRAFHPHYTSRTKLPSSFQPQSVSIVRDIALNLKDTSATNAARRQHPVFVASKTFIMIKAFTLSALYSGGGGKLFVSIQVKPLAPPPNPWLTLTVAECRCLMN